MTRLHRSAVAIITAGALTLVGAAAIGPVAATSAPTGRAASQYPPTTVTTTTRPSTSTSTSTSTTTSSTTTTIADTTSTVAPIEVSDEIITPGRTFEVTINGCADGEEVTLTVRDDAGTVLDEQTVICAEGRATASFAGARAPGTYNIQATGTNGFTATTSITVAVAGPTTTASGTLPGTGSNSTGPLAAAGVALLLTGAGILVVARVRRRPATA